CLLRFPTERLFNLFVSKPSRRFRPHPPRGWRRAEGCRSPAAYLPDDLVVEILSRLPARSLCRFKCVSRSWRALISDRFSFAQTLSGFFFSSRRDIAAGPPCGFAGLPPPLPRVDTALSFLPPSGGAIELLDSCKAATGSSSCSAPVNPGRRFPPSTSSATQSLRSGLRCPSPATLRELLKCSM
ncbi:uncharacterized protein LOC112881278, partial [Panicum hallii]|uniref:uncharacterized protein LOC112881278 n=1 Tax=Panicum hallii TaxID=206008 RepID=UPI000DF4E3C1